MSNHRFFLVGSLTGDSGVQRLPLSTGDLRHAIRVLRVKAGETVEVVDPGGIAWSACVTVVGSDALEADVRGRTESAGRVASPRVTLFQGVAKGEKMDGVIRQAVEIGATAIVPVLTARSVVKLDARKRVERGERWRRVAEAAAKQSHRDSVPHVSDPVGFARAVELLGEYERVVVLWEECRDDGLVEALAGGAVGEGAGIALVVGPEGGLSAEEVDALVAQGARIATLGPSVLRTETAAIVALALAIHELGGLGSRL